MAEETLVKEALTPEMVDSGWELVRALKDRQVEISACFWLYSSEVNDWKFALCLPQVDKDGPLRAYETIQSVIREPSVRPSEPGRFDRLFQLYLDAITVFGPSNKLVRSILEVPLDPNSSGVRFKRSRLGDSFFDDVYIYNLSSLSK